MERKDVIVFIQNRLEEMHNSSHGYNTMEWQAYVTVLQDLSFREWQEADDLKKGKA